MINKDKRVQTYLLWSTAKFSKKICTLCWKFSAWLGEDHGRWPSLWREILGKMAIAVGLVFWGIEGRCSFACCELNPLTDEERKKLKEGLLFN